MKSQATKTRSYNQFCALAYALDIVGERWTLLIIRELLTGPRRFKDLLDGLPDISTNLLSERLKSLEEQGILNRRVLPPPAGSTVYELTSAGRALETPVIELGRWGAQFLPPSLDGVNLPSVGVMALALKAFFRPQQAEGVHENYEFHIDNELLQVKIDDGALHVQQGAAPNADAVFYTVMPVFLGLFAGQIQPEEALAGGLIRVEGDPGALTRFLEVCGVPRVR
jgi:DNA-binding HxlR family transcriptional regulator